MFVVLPVETILRIVDTLLQPPSQAAEYRLGTDSPESRRDRPVLAPRVADALNRAKRDESLREFTDKDGKLKRAGKEVGPPSRDEFAALREWCSAMGLSADADAVDAAVRAARA